MIRSLVHAAFEDQPDAPVAQLLQPTEGRVRHVEMIHDDAVDVGPPDRVAKSRDGELRPVEREMSSWLDDGRKQQAADVTGEKDRAGTAAGHPLFPRPEFLESI